MGCSGSKGADAGALSSPDAGSAMGPTAEKKHYKVLLLGAGESGKSTVLKQVKMIYRGGMGKKDKDICMTAIRKNAIESMQTILGAMDSMGGKLANPALEEAKQRTQALEEDCEFSYAIADDILVLWEDEGVKEIYNARGSYWLLDGAAYYFDNVSRMADPEYEPSEEDVIMTRVRTTGIDTTEFTEHGRSYSIVDVGGQRNERRKWIHCFDNVKAVVYLVGLSGYNQRLFEESSINRLQESMKLFKQVVGNPIFKDTPVFLFLNKKDLFEQQIKEAPLSVCFPDYTGPPDDVHASLDFVEQKFRAVMSQCCPDKQVYTHVVAARVRMEMKIAWGDVKDQLKNIYDDTPRKGRKGSKSSRV
ncbi:unnamed protein product [Chrysoparadoxa australica]